jgi:hypothetical protein
MSFLKLLTIMNICLGLSTRIFTPMYARFLFFSIDKDFMDVIKQLAPNLESSEIVLYCSDYYCPTSGQAGKKLLGSGYKHVFKYRHGLAGWLESGNQTEKGPNYSAE